MSTSSNNKVSYVHLNDPTAEGTGWTSPQVGAEKDEPYLTVDSCSNLPQTTAWGDCETEPGTVNGDQEITTSLVEEGRKSKMLSSQAPLAKATPGNYGVLINDAKTPIGEPTKGSENDLTFYRTKDFNPLIDFPPVSYVRSMINLFNNMIGTTILALPYAMLEVGLSAPIVLAFAVLCVYQSSIFLLESFHEDGDPSKRQLRYYYWHISSAAFGSFGEVFMANFQRVSYLLDNGWALVLSSNSMNSVFDLQNFNWVMIFCAIIVTECIWFPNQKSLFWISTIGVFNTFVCCVTLGVICIGTSIEDTSLMSTFQDYVFFNLEGFFVSFNIIVLSFCTILVIPNIYMEMEEKHRVRSLLYWGHIIPMFMKVVFMILVFYTYQSDTDEIAILNVDNTYLRGVVAVTITIDKLVTVPLWLYPNRIEMEDFFWNWVKPSVRKMFRGKFIARSLLTLVVSTTLLIPSVILAFLVPSYWDCSVLIGCIIVTPQTLIIPNIQWLILKKQKPVWKQLVAISILIIGLVCSIGGLVVTIIAGDL